MNPLPEEGRPSMPGEGPRIVVVEDDAGMSQAIERILGAGGFAAVAFASAEAALQADWARTDCLVLDIRLPGMSGLDLYRRLTESGKAMPAIFMTGTDEPAVREQAERLGGAGSYLLKPFSGEQLLDAVTRALGGH